MKLSEFQETYHWMNGLSEYFKYTGQHERWEEIHKALYHDNWYRKRDVILELCSMRNSNPVHVKSWMNVLLHDKLEDFEIKPQLLATLLRKYMKEDEFLVNVCKFINYWSGENGEAADMPDINDFLSRGQVKSKLWMVSELANIIDGPLGNIVFYGGWYNFLAHFLFNQFDVSKIYSLDIDDKVAVPSKRLYPSQVASNRFIPVTTDVNKINWDNKTLRYTDYDLRDQQINRWMTKQEEALTVKRQEQIDTWLKKQEAKYAHEIEAKEDNIRQGYTSKEKIREDIFKDKDAVIEKFSVELREELFKDKDKLLENKFGWVELDNINCVINTSCEHMDNTWYENLPIGTFVVLQTNDYFSNPQHSNCCKDLEEVKSKYPMQSISYEGELDTHLYNRFMLIGIK